jgi:hypothetical protein
MKALLWRCRSITLALQEHCFSVAGALLLCCRSIAFALQEHGFMLTGGMVWEIKRE